MSEETNFETIMKALIVLERNQQKIFELLSERSKEVITKEMGGEKSKTGIKGNRDKSCGSMASFCNSKPPVVSEHVSGINLEESVINFSTVYEGREYKGKWKPCKYKCGGLVSWPKDYKQGDKTLHVHPTDWEILGFSQKGLDGDMHCPLVRKK